MSKRHTIGDMWLFAGEQTEGNGIRYGPGSGAKDDGGCLSGNEYADLIVCYCKAAAILK
jgi:hypothetical protein